MTPEEILNGNIIIAEYDGYQIVLIENKNFKTPFPHRFADNDEVFEPLKYHSLWDWQIPVLSKVIKDLSHDKEMYFVYAYNQSVIRNQPIEGFKTLIKVIEFINKNKS